ncbi:MAG: heavy metal translocating P-type ATPase [Campylobacterales bacterium]|nr:heavy metal translocating P-type ATPase [Campylobacterales bacterium]
MSKTACSHCHLEFEKDEMISDNNGAKELFFCCKGCQGVYHLLQDQGLDSFYGKLGSKTLEPPKHLVDDSSRFDYEGFHKRYVTDRADGYKEISLIIEGIHCAACVWLNEKILTRAEGVIEANINFTNNKARIVWDEDKIKLSNIIDRIRSIGYDALPYDSRVQEESANRLRRQNYTKMIVGVFATMNIMWIAVALYAGYFTGIEEGHKNILHLAEFILASITLFYSGSIFYKGAWGALKHGFVTMDTLVATGSTLTYSYSIYASLTHVGEAYFDSVTMIITFVLVGKYLETLSKKQAVDTLDTLSSLIPTEVCVYADGKSEYKQIESVEVGEIVEMKAGDVAALDGDVILGEANFDESTLSGESEPVLKRDGDKITSGSKNLDGMVHYRVTRDFKHSSFSEIVRLLSESLEKKPKIESMANLLSRYFSVTILSIATLTFIGWLYTGASLEKALVVSVSVIIIACPCALALATPIASVIGLYAAAKKGAIFKSSSMLETIAKADILVLDKTGTLTEGKPKVVNETAFASYDKTMLATLVSISRHPVSEAIFEYMHEVPTSAETQKEIRSQGLEATVNGIKLLGGNLEFLSAQGIKSEFESEKTLFAYAENGELKAIFELEDKIKEGADLAVAQAKQSGLRVVMLTGDNERSASSVAQKLGIDEYKSKMTPATKLAFIEEAQKSGAIVIMAGDGINDSLALARADIGIAMASGAEINLQTSDIVLLKNSLIELKNAIAIGRKTYRTIKQNIGISIVYNAITIPLAAMGFVIPLVAAISMSFSSILVVLNSTKIKNGV